MNPCLFCCPQAQTEKNRRCICPISNDLPPAYTWGSPPKQPLCQEGLSS